MIWAVVIVAVLALAGCAIAIGDRSSARVNTSSEVKRELGDEAPTIEELILTTPKEKPHVR